MVRRSRQRASFVACRHCQKRFSRHQPWTDFVESLGIPYPGIKKRRDWTRAALLSEIQRWQAEGNPLNYRAVKNTYQALIHQARKYFGSWDAARAAAGV